MLLPLSYTQVTAVFAADAVARLSGVVGVAAVTAGPGKGIFSFRIIVNHMHKIIIDCVSQGVLPHWIFKTVHSLRNITRSPNIPNHVRNPGYLQTHLA